MVKVEVEQGWLEGEVLDCCTGDGQYYSFKGIPYAAPPLGKLRFKAPQPPQPWEGVKQAKEHGPRCIHTNLLTNAPESGSEDCLYLNVYSPNIKPDNLISVMFFIHGGGYKSGSGNEDLYGPDFLVSHNIVLVTINYRLDVLGFLCLDTKEVPGNAGLKDQVAALRWVKKNIENFGGDPSNITIFGESAGGASTAYHTLSPMSRGLFNRAISMSGVPYCDWTIPFEPKRKAHILGKKLGFVTKDTDKLLEFLQSVPVEKLIGTNPTLLISEEIHNIIIKMFHFTPVIEKDFGQECFLTESPYDILKKKEIPNVEVMMGYTEEEATTGVKLCEDSYLKTYNTYPEMLVPRRIFLNSNAEKIIEISDRIHNHYFEDKEINEETMKEFLTYISEQNFVYYILKYLTDFSEASERRIYLYRFDCVSERNIFGNMGTKYGVAKPGHMDELMYLFDPKQSKLELDKNGESYKMIQQTCSLFSNFAKYGNPTPDNSLGVTWPTYNNDTKKGLLINKILTVSDNLGAEAVAFWDSIFKDYGFNY